MVGVAYVDGYHVTTVSAINLLLTNNLASLIFQRTLEESDLALPERCSDPEIRLLVEES